MVYVTTAFVLAELTFTRPDLMKAKEYNGFFNEQDVKWINPREYYRKIISDLENLGFKIARDKNEKLTIKQEAIGSKTGYITSRVQGIKTEGAQGSMKYKPHLQTAILAIFASIILIGVSTQIQKSYYMDIIGLSVITFILGIILYTRSRTAKIPLLLSSVINILAEGEATERKYTQEGTEVTDLLAQLTVSISGIKKVSAVIAAMDEEKARQALRKSVPDAETPRTIINTPLKNYIPPSISKTFQEDTKALENTLNTLTQKLETYGHTI